MILSQDPFLKFAITGVVRPMIRSGCLLLAVLFATGSYSQNASKMTEKQKKIRSIYLAHEHETYLDYFAFSPSGRFIFLEKVIADKGMIDAHQFAVISGDLATLSDVRLRTTDGLSTGNGAYHVSDPDQFKAQLLSLAEPLADTVRFRSDSTYLQTNFTAGALAKNSAPTIRDTLRLYTSNSPANRIVFLEQHHEDLSLSFLQVAQKDLDSIYGVITESIIPNRILDRDRLKSALETWRSKIIFN